MKQMTNQDWTRLEAYSKKKYEKGFSHTEKQPKHVPYWVRRNRIRHKREKQADQKSSVNINWKKYMNKYGKHNANSRLWNLLHPDKHKVYRGRSYTRKFINDMMNGDDVDNVQMWINDRRQLLNQYGKDDK